MNRAMEVSRKGCRVLIRAIYRKDRQKIAKLLMRGANVNSSDYNGNTPLHHAVASRDIEIVRLIIEHGANVDALNDSRIGPYDVAFKNLFVEALELLLKNDVKVPNMAESFSMLPEHIVAMICDKISLQECNARGYTVLHVATANNDIFAVRRLLERGADVKVRTAFKKESPLHLVISSEVARVLLDYGADINRHDRFSCSPLSSVAVHSRRNLTRDEQSRIIELLVERGAELMQVLAYAERKLNFASDFEQTHGIRDVLKFMALTDRKAYFRKRMFSSAFYTFYCRVIAEVTKMKGTIFYDHISFYQFICTSWQRGTNYIEDSRITRAVYVERAVDELPSRFPLYFTILKRHIDAAIARNKLRENSATALTLVYPKLKLDQHAAHQIVLFLDKQDMEYIIEATED